MRCPHALNALAIGYLTNDTKGTKADIQLQI
jgi:hypothetical protein